MEIAIPIREIGVPPHCGRHNEEKENLPKVIDKAKSIIESVLRQESNRRRGNREITSFFISKPSKVIDNFEGITNFEFDEVEIPDDFNTTKEG